jgi:hypothetical protein
MKVFFQSADFLDDDGFSNECSVPVQKVRLRIRCDSSHLLSFYDESQGRLDWIWLVTKKGCIFSIDYRVLENGS